MEKESTKKLAQARKGCIKTTMGPWIARRIGADGVERTSLRRPSPEEREKNRQRERHRRSVKARIYSCLRAYGKYRLPKHPDHNDILMALCQEAGWHVEEDGTIYRKVSLYLYILFLGSDAANYLARGEVFVMDQFYVFCVEM